LGAVPASLWIESCPETDYPPLHGTVAVDVAILGAGIVGATAATLLKRAGRTVALVESKRVARGVTGYTTAKLTSGHGLIYANLAERFGPDGAQAYAESNQAAIQLVTRLVEELRIECDLERRPNLVYTERSAEVGQIEAEVEAASRAGLSVSFVNDTDLPFPVAGAIRLEDQAQFHPLKYLLPLVETVAGAGSHVFEQTRALDVEEDDRCRVETDRGTVVARHVIVATHIPFLDRGFFFAKEHPQRSYAIAMPLGDGATPEGMYINVSAPTRSIRTAPSDSGRLLLLGGEGHRPGEERNTERRYRNLEAFARDAFGIADPPTHRWSTQDYATVDRLPYIGRLTRRSEHILVATGFGKWGMSNGTLAAQILTDAVLGRRNLWASLYDAKRVKPVASARTFATENAKVAAHWVGDRVEARPLADLQPGEGGIVKADGRRVAAYRDDDGAVHAVSPVCTHLGCYVQWNDAEESWDCPCHGSRFGTDGSVIQGPAVKDLRQVSTS
jgi:glycine/D-amino acid oxidase-like deaminating enzyme/nitrite reductase/ring-hydroxylating ferredoxin subunit